MIHWFCCAWGVLAQYMGTLRTATLENARLDSSDGCERGNVECLSECEVEILASMRNESTTLVRNGEMWICRAISAGMIPASVADPNSPHHMELYLFVLGADVSGPGFVSPTCNLEFALNFVFQFM